MTMESREEPRAGSPGPEDGVDLHRIVGHRDDWRQDFSRPTWRPPVFGCLSQPMAAAACTSMSASAAAPSTAAMSRSVTTFARILTKRARTQM